MAVTLADKLQDYRPEEQLAALAALFLFHCEILRTPPQDVFSVVTKTFYEGDGSMRLEYRAMKAYLEDDVLRAQ